MEIIEGSRSNSSLTRLERFKDGLIEEQKKHPKKSDIYMNSQFLITIVSAFFELLEEDYQDLIEVYEDVKD